MKRIAVCSCVVLSLAFGVVGCAEKTQVKETKQVTTPGGSDTKTTTVEERKTGDHKDDNAGTTPAPGTAPANP